MTMPMHAAVLRAALMAAALWLPAVAAAEDKADLKFDNKLLEASVSIDAALKTYPGLAADRASWSPRSARTVMTAGRR